MKTIIVDGLKKCLTISTGTVITCVLLGDSLGSPGHAEETVPGDAGGQTREQRPLSDERGDESFIPPMTSLSSIFQGFEAYGDRLFANRPGASAHQRPMWGPSKLKIVDPKEVPRITSLDNDDPNSFFYTDRPNLFNIAVDDEWDWNNLINTDRSDFTDTPYTVGEGIAVLETGITNTRVNSPDGHATLRSLPESLLRAGVTNEFELRFKWLGYQMLNQEDVQTGATASAFGGSDFDLGFKWTMFQQKNWFPMTTLVGGALIPTGTNGFSGNSVQPHFNIVNGWEVRRYIYLKHQFGLDYLTQPEFSVTGPSGGTGPVLTGTRSALDSYHSSISCLYQATKHTGGFVEWFALFGPNQQATNFCDTGVFFYLTPNIQLDGTVGSSIAAQDTNTLFTKIGFSTRW